MTKNYSYDVNPGGFSSSQVLMTIASIAATLIALYSMCIWLRIILTWIKIPGQMQENPVARFLGKIVDPYLNWFKGIESLRRSRLDLTPLVALAVLSIAQSMLRLLGTYGKLTVGLVGGLVLQTLWGYIISPILFFIIVLLIIRLVFCYKRGPNSIQYIKMLDTMIGGILNWVQNLFYKHQTINDRQLVITALVFFAIVYLVCSGVLGLAVSALARLPY
ncbi:YggT family protein [uncultured Sphaerochaeta sp.]|uniref:YggT family protein n=1 Tax=uncultured Sphaerochaeta sp. TaxID=886478 RepID=UPI002A0A3C24|nr:YggT family protein [uncultured Sphaerochaeta sp.]